LCFHPQPFTFFPLPFSLYLQPFVKLANKQFHFNIFF
jgi:hypothetical protein